MNAQDVDAVVKRANAAGYDSIAAYAVALEKCVDQLLTVTTGLCRPVAPDLIDRALAAGAIRSARQVLGERP